MGRVYQAELVGPFGFRKPVALKVLTADDDAFVLEGQLGAWMCHPNVLSTYEVGHVDGQPFIAMELVTGGGVAKSLAPLDEARAVDVVTQACAGLAYIHEVERDGVPLRLVHRDIKPANLLIHPDGRVQVADFGIATMGGDRAHASGTPGFASPEQIAGRAEQASDVFGLGATLYALVRGGSPFGRGIDAIEATPRGASWLDDHGLLDGWSPQGRSLLVAMLQAEPSRRPPTRDLLSALRSAREVLAQSSASVGWVARAHSQPVDSNSETVHRPLTNIPARSVIGRDDALASLGRLLGSARLVVLLGPGGVGKTSLASVAGRQWIEGTGREAWFVDLASVRSSDDVDAAIAVAAGVPDPRRLGPALSARRAVLLVLDNAEHVVDGVARVARQAMGWASVTLLVTSQVRVGLAHEKIMGVAPLSVASAEALFEERAGVAPPDGLVDRLDRLPLALELAAGRVALLGLANIVRQVSEDGDEPGTGPFAVLRTRRRGGNARHRSLEASIAWSVGLLAEASRQVLFRLSVFSGAFALDDVLGMVADQGLDHLEELLERGLVHRDGERFRLLMSVRMFARQQLSASARSALRRELAVYLAGLRPSRTTLDAVTQERLVAREPDLVEAFEHCAARGEGALAVKLCIAVDACTPRGRDVWARWERCLSLDLDDVDRAFALMRTSHGQPRAGRLRRLDRAARLDPSSPRVHLVLAWALRDAGDDDGAWRHASIGLELARQQGCVAGIAHHWVSVAVSQRRYEDVRRFVDDGGAIEEPRVRAEFALIEGDVAAALAAYREFGLLYQCDMEARLGLPQAREPLRRAQAAFRRQGDVDHDIYCAGALARLAFHAGDQEDAAVQRSRIADAGGDVRVNLLFVAKVQAAMGPLPWGSAAWLEGYRALLTTAEAMPKALDGMRQRVHLALADGLQESGELDAAARHLDGLDREALAVDPLRLHYAQVLEVRQRWLLGDDASVDEMARLAERWDSWGGGPWSRCAEVAGQVLGDGADR